MTDLEIELENERLRASWNCFPIEHLDTYLSVEEQDQRINAHSILTRGLLIDTLWPGKFDALIDEEMRFGIVMTWLLQSLKAGAERMDLLNRILRSADGGEDKGVPEIVRATAKWLQGGTCAIPDYISDALMSFDPSVSQSFLGESALDTFYGIWAAQLRAMPANPILVLEVACGSGNDFQAIRDCGIGPFIRYSGFDISSKNIENARRKFTDVDFFEASVLNSGLEDESFDYVFAHDVIGHLSGEGMERALREIMRIVREEAWIHCYNAVEIPRHEIRPFEQYFRNRISIPQFSSSLAALGASVRVIPLPDLLRRKFGFVQDYTATSATFIAAKTR